MAAQRFPFRRWTQREGRFVGSFLKHLSDGSIEISQAQYADGLKALKVPRGVNLEEPIPLGMFAEFRGLLGAGCWIAGQTRPDLAYAVSTGLTPCGSLK